MTTQGAWLNRDGETVAVHFEKQTLLQIPIHTLLGVVCFGQVNCTPFLMGLCAERGVGLSFLTEHGRFLARVDGPVSGNVLLRRRQYRVADEESGSASIARAVVLAKVANCRTVLLRAARERAEDEGKQAMDAAALRLRRILEEIGKGDSVDRIRGHEGDAARIYFDVFDHLILTGKDEFFFRAEAGGRRLTI